jgi:hypothetical protein
MPHFDFGTAEVFLFMIAFVVVFLVLGVVELLGMHAETRRGQIVGLFVVLGLLAGLPFWGTLFYLLIASLGENSRALWAIAPWLLECAATRFGGVSVGCAVLSGLAYAVGSGDHRQNGNECARSWECWSRARSSTRPSRSTRRFIDAVTLRQVGRRWLLSANPQARRAINLIPSRR